MLYSPLRGAALAAAAAFALGTAAAATGSCFTISYDKPLYDVTDIGTLHVSGAPGAYGVLLFDLVPGPVTVAGIGVLGVGVSPNLALLPILPLSECGSTNFLRSTFPCGTLEVGNPIYTQAVGLDYATGSVCLSNVAVLNALDLNGTCGNCQEKLTGCTPGYWKNHTNKWGPTGLHKNDDFDAVFGVDAFDSVLTLKDALKPTSSNYKNLVPHAVAALLNARHPAENFPYSPEQVIQMTRQALTSGDAKLQESIKNVLATTNELGCPF
jgi:hypothetical protein